jgi:hypothetical protein
MFDRIIVFRIFFFLKKKRKKKKRKEEALDSFTLVGETSRGNFGKARPHL